MIERASDYLQYFILKDDHKNQDDLIVRLLGIRMFNGIGACLKLLLSGYYQPAGQQVRDLIETLFLLDYLSMDRKLIAEWRDADDETRWRKFSPKVVRKALDVRDKFTKKKRGELYKIISGLAGHPNPVGFILLKQANGKHSCGPFFEKTLFEATLFELAKASTQVGSVFGSFFTPSTKLEYQTKVDFMEHNNAWVEETHGRILFEKPKIAELRKLISRMPN